MLDTVYTWMTKWRITLNLKKSKCVHFRPKTLEKTNYQFHINNVPLEFSESYKYLGVYFNQFLDFEENVSILSQAASRALGGIINKYETNNNMGFSIYTKNYLSHAWYLL